MHAARRRAVRNGAEGCSATRDLAHWPPSRHGRPPWHCGIALGDRGGRRSGPRACRRARRARERDQRHERDRHTRVVLQRLRELRQAHRMKCAVQQTVQCVVGVVRGIMVLVLQRAVALLPAGARPRAVRRRLRRGRRAGGRAAARPPRRAEPPPAPLERRRRGRLAAGGAARGRPQARGAGHCCGAARRRLQDREQAVMRYALGSDST